MPIVLQLVPHLVPADAISGHTRQLRDALRAAGFDSDIVAEVIHPRFRREARRFGDLTGRTDADLFIYQCSTGSPMAEWLVREQRPFIVDYHNVTPASFFEPWDSDAAANMRRARQQLQLLAPRALASVADSAFNAAELIELGFRDVSVAPPLLPAHDELRPDRAMDGYLARTRAGARWLFVGRIAPNKCQHDVLAAFAAYRRLFDASARLILVGTNACPSYHDWLLELIDRLELGTAATLAGTVTDEELVSIYNAADVFVCLSEHEGFCLPVVEAMAHRVPVLAVARGALPDTVGQGGLLLDDKDPLTVAVAVHTLMTDASLTASLGPASRARLAELPTNDASRYVEAVRGALANGRRV